jgi:hypothetical protein
MKADRTLMKHRRPTGRRGSRSWIAAAVAFAATGAALILALPLASRANAANPPGHANSECATRTLARGFATYVPALRTYDDNIEDSGNAPDFCASELVTNDRTTITLGIHAHNRTGFIAGDAYTVYLDTDRNATTGGGGVGAEYEIAFTGPLAQLEQWNGTAFDPTSAVPVPLIWVPDYGPVLVFLRSAIGDPAGFNFVLVSTNGQAGDRAPDTGSWSYSTVPFALKMTSLSLGLARAGKTMTARAMVMRSDVDGPLDQGTIGCAAKVGHYYLAGKGKFAGSRVVCTWRVPKNTGGQRLSGTVSVSYQGVRVARSFAARVR